MDLSICIFVALFLLFRFAFCLLFFAFILLFSRQKAKKNKIKAQKMQMDKSIFSHVFPFLSFLFFPLFFPFYFAFVFFWILLICFLFFPFFAFFARFSSFKKIRISGGLVNLNPAYSYHPSRSLMCLMKGNQVSS